MSRHFSRRLNLLVVLADTAVGSLPSTPGVVRVVPMPPAVSLNGLSSVDISVVLLSEARRLAKFTSACIATFAAEAVCFGPSGRRAVPVVFAVGHRRLAGAGPGQELDPFMEHLVLQGCASGVERFVEALREWPGLVPMMVASPLSATLMPFCFSVAPATMESAFEDAVGRWCAGRRHVNEWLPVLPSTMAAP